MTDSSIEPTRQPQPGAPELTQPDWVLLGVSAPNGVWIFGSLELTEAEIRMERDFQDIAESMFIRAVPVPHSTRIFFTVEMKRYAAVFGTTYREALANLFEFWDADEQHKPNPLALPPGD